MSILTPEQKDVFKELVNIGLGRAAGILNELVQSRVYLQTPVIYAFKVKSLEDNLDLFGPKPLASVVTNFSGPYSGVSALVFPPEAALNLVSLLTGEEPYLPNLDTLRIGTLSEVGNIVLNGVLGSIANMLGHRLHFSLPLVVEDTFSKFITDRFANPESVLLVAKTHFSIQNREIDGDILLLFEMASFTKLLAAIDQLLEETVERL